MNIAGVGECVRSRLNFGREVAPDLAEFTKVGRTHLEFADLTPRSVEILPNLAGPIPMLIDPTCNWADTTPNLVKSTRTWPDFSQV